MRFSRLSLAACVYAGLAVLTGRSASAGSAGAPARQPMAERPTITNNRPPRKVIVGTTNQGFWGKSPKLDERFSMLAGLVGKMAADAKKK